MSRMFFNCDMFQSCPLTDYCDTHRCDELLQLPFLPIVRPNPYDFQKGRLNLSRDNFGATSAVKERT